MSGPEINKSFSAASALFAVAIGEIETKDEMFVSQMETSREYAKTAKSEAEAAHDDRLDSAATRMVGDMLNSSAQVTGGLVDTGGAASMARINVEKSGSALAQKRVSDLQGDIDGYKMQRDELGNRMVDDGGTGSGKMKLSSATEADVEVWQNKRDGIKDQLKDNTLDPTERNRLQGELESLEGDIDAYHEYKSLGEKQTAAEQELDKVMAEEINRLTSIQETKIRGQSAAAQGIIKTIANGVNFDAEVTSIEAAKHDTVRDWAENLLSAYTSLANKAAGSKDTIASSLEEARQKEGAVMSRVTQES